MSAEQQFFNRDLSWLEFNRRVLAQAMDTNLPLLERVNFLAIFTSNLDEFYMKRIGLLRRLVRAGQTVTPAHLPPDGLSPAQVLAEARQTVLQMQELHAETWEHDLRPALAACGIEIVEYENLSERQRVWAEGWYRQNVFPVLTPLAVDPGHRFPFISNLSVNLGVLLESPRRSERQFARVKVPDALPQLVQLPSPDGSAPALRFVALHELILHNLDDLFPGLKIVDVLPFRVTRSVGVSGDDEDAADLLAHVEAELRKRRFADVVRIEIPPSPSAPVLELVTQALGLSSEDVFVRQGVLGDSTLYEISRLEPPAPEALTTPIRYEPWTPVTPPALREAESDLFSIIRQKDILLHHPYESFRDSVERFVATAARDPDVLAIKQTLYRTSPDSPFVSSLVRAAEEGKQVACLVELRARFDEQRNVRFARMLEKAGVHVAYGVVGLKTHCKCSLVVRKEPDGLRTYAHVGTGNYHPRTAQLYTDLGLMTCNPRITEDVVNVFNVLTGHAHQGEYNELLVAPQTMRPALEGLIDAETGHARAGRPARIVAKMNSLEDRRIAERLYEASSAGVRVELYVRGFCCLRPGVPGLSENISVVSVIGRFLEHSRIFHFGGGHDDPLLGTWYIGSADWMYRNLNNRVEACVPVYEPEARARLWRIFEIMSRDRARAWELHPDGTYRRREEHGQFDPTSPEAAGTFVAMMNETLKSG